MSLSNNPNKNKKIMLEALEKSLGIVSEACRNCDVGRTQHYEYIKTDPKYKEEVQRIQNAVLDMAESSLYTQIKNGNPTSTIFFLKTKGKSRGYIEKQEIDMRIEPKIDLSKLSNKQLQDFEKLIKIAEVGNDED